VSLAQRLWVDNADLAGRALAHPFVRGVADGSLPRQVFSGYVAQDAFFLEAFARAYALALAASPDTETVLAFAGLIAGVRDELSMHAAYTARWGVDPSTTSPAGATLAYTEFAGDGGDRHRRAGVRSNDTVHAPVRTSRTVVGRRGGCRGQPLRLVGHGVCRPCVRRPRGPARGAARCTRDRHPGSAGGIRPGDAAGACLLRRRIYPDTAPASMTSASRSDPYARHCTHLDSL
jgi:TENA/THI-4/PQQC family